MSNPNTLLEYDRKRMELKTFYYACRYATEDAQKFEVWCSELLQRQPAGYTRFRYPSPTQHKRVNALLENLAFIEDHFGPEIASNSWNPVPHMPIEVSGLPEFVQT